MTAERLAIDVGLATASALPWVVGPFDIGCGGGVTTGVWVPVGRLANACFFFFFFFCMMALLTWRDLYDRLWFMPSGNILEPFAALPRV